MTSHGFVNSSARDIGLQLASSSLQGKVFVAAYDKDYLAQIESALEYVSALDSDRAIVRGLAVTVCREHSVYIRVRAIRKFNHAVDGFSVGRSNGNVVHPDACVLISATARRTAFINGACRTGEPVPPCALATGNVASLSVVCRRFRLVTSPRASATLVM
jgi:hypothetical protein